MIKKIGLMFILTVIMLMCACQPTPDNSAVQSKGNGTLDSALAEDAQKIVIDAPETVQLEYEAKADNTKIIIDAPVTYPKNITAIQAQEIKPKEFDEAFLSTVCSACFGNSPAYEPQNEMTKADIQEILTYLESKMSDAYLDATYGADEVSKENVRSRNKLLHESYAKMYSKAPADISKIASVPKLQPMKYWITDVAMSAYIAEAEASGSDDRLSALKSDEPTRFEAVSYFDDGYVGFISVEAKYASTIIAYNKSKVVSNYTSVSSGDIAHPVPIDYWGQKDGTSVYLLPCDTVPCTLPEAEAKEEAQRLIDSLGLDDELAIASCKKESNTYGQEWYNVIYRRTLSGVIMTQNPESNGEIVNRAGVPDEYLSCLITDDGVVAWSYQQPMTVTDIVNEGVGIITFDDALEIYKKQSALTYDNIISVTEGYEGGDEAIEYSKNTLVKITKIEFCLVRIAKKDSNLTYYVLPVWSFSGTLTHTDKDGQTFPRPTTLMVNAVDGSIVSSADCW